MNRLDQIRMLAKRIKYVPVSKLTPERLAHRRQRTSRNVRKYFKRKREKGLCESCRSVAVDIVYEHEGKRLIVRRTNYCPKHWRSESIKKEMLGDSYKLDVADHNDRSLNIVPNKNTECGSFITSNRLVSITGNS